MPSDNAHPALSIAGLNAMLDATQAEREAARAAEEKRAGELESQACGRCGGSGRYSFCYSHGTKCFDCGGKGRVLTKRGALAAAYRATLRSKVTRDLTAGDKLWNPGVAGFIPGRWELVAGVEVIGERARIVYSGGGVGSWGPSSGPTRVAQTSAQMDATHAEALRYQAALVLTKAGKVAKRAPRAARAAKVAA